MKFNKKPLIIGAILISMLAATFYLATNVESKAIPSKFIPKARPFDEVVEGDINFDGRIDVIDLTLIISYLKEFHAMDMDNNGKINMDDVNLLSKEIFGSDLKATMVP